MRVLHKGFSEASKGSLAKGQRSRYVELFAKSTHAPRIPGEGDKNRKLHPRQRLELLLDPGSFFLELSQLAGQDLYGKDSVHGGGLISGIGVVSGKLTMIIANDYTQKAGSYFPITVKKQLRAQEIAGQLRLPTIYLADSAGANLPRQADVFPDRDHFGRIFYNIARMSAAGVGQIAVVLGSCTAGGAYVPAMCDQAIIVANQGTVFLAGPPLVKAATSEEVSAEELGGGAVHTRRSGVCDFLAADEFDALAEARKTVARLPESFDFKLSDSLKKLATTTGNSRVALRRFAESVDPSLTSPVAVEPLLQALLDGPFEEFKPEYGESLATVFGTLAGIPVGVLVNRAPLFSESALKAAHFIQLCNQRGTPLIFLHNITGFAVGRNAEWGGIAKNGAKMVNAVACASVPKLSLVFGASYGAGNYGMCGRGYSPDFLFTWPDSRVGVMGGAQAAQVMTSIQKGLTEEAKEQYYQQLKSKYESESEAIFGTARLWDDGVILPEFTREALGLALIAAMNNRSKHEPGKASNFGIFRM